MSKYGIGQDVKWVAPNLHLLVGYLDDGGWRWTDHPLPHRAKCNLRERRLFVRGDDGLWTLTPDTIDAVEKLARERGYDEEEIFVSG